MFPLSNIVMHALLSQMRKFFFNEPAQFRCFYKFFLLFSSRRSKRELVMHAFTYILLTVTWFFFLFTSAKILSRSRYFMNEKWNERLVLQHETCYDGGGWWSVCITWSFWLSHWSRSPTILRALFHSRFFSHHHAWYRWCCCCCCFVKRDVIKRFIAMNYFE